MIVNIIKIYHQIQYCCLCCLTVRMIPKDKTSFLGPLKTSHAKGNRGSKFEGSQGL